MQLKEILSIESNRTEDSKCVIHLFQEGSFYRAYEWSAWLCQRITGTGTVDPQKQGIVYKLDVLSALLLLLWTLRC